MRTFVRLLAISTSLYHLLYASSLLDYVGVELYGTHRGLSVGLILTLVFLLVPATKSSKDKLPWYDFLLILFSLAPTLYFSYRYFTELELVGLRAAVLTSFEFALAAMLWISTLEAVRRCIAWPVAAIGVLFTLYMLLAGHLPGIFFAHPISLTMAAGELYFSWGGILGLTTELFATVVAVFIIFGEFVASSGAGEFFLNICLALLGRFTGGPAKAAVVGSAAFGTISGIAVANVVTTGTITIPLMKKIGYKDYYAGAVEAVASTGGAIMPPVMGIIAFIMADVLGVSYWSVCVAAAIPAVLYYVAVFAQVHFEALKLGMRGLPKEEIPKLGSTLKAGWYFTIPVVLLIYLMGVLGYSPTKAGLAALISLVVVSFFRKETRLGPRKISASLEKSAEGLMRILPAGGAVGIIMAACSLTALGLRLSGGLVDLAGGNLFILLLLTAVCALIMGMGMSLIVIYVVLAVMVAPALTGMGIMPMAAHLFLVYYATVGLITPPVCIAAYAAAGIARSDPMRTGWQATKLGIVAFIIPFAFVYNPNLLMRGPPAQVVIATVATLIGTVAIAAAFERHLLVRALWWEVILFGVGGVALFIPNLAIGLLGAALVGLAIISQLGLFKRRREAVQS